MLALAALLVLPACSSADSRLYHAGDPPRLRDGTIRMTTYWIPGKDQVHDERIIRARDGQVSVSHISHDHGHKVGEASAEEWTDLWSTLFDAKPFDRSGFGREDPDPTGGPYHVISLLLGDDAGVVSAQMRQDLLVFSSREVAERMRYSNAVVSFVAEHATRPLEEALKEGSSPDAP